MKRLLFLLLFPMACFAQGAFYTAGPFSSAGLMYVCPVPDNGLPCPSPVSIFSNAALTTPVPNPLTVQAGSAPGFWVTPGQYTIQMPASNYRQVVTIGGGGGGSGTSVGPVINVTNPTYGAVSSPSADNTTALTAAANAANAAAAVTVGTPTVRAVTNAAAISQTTFTLPVVVQTGDTVIIGLIGGPTGTHTVTVSDGTNIYYPLTVPFPTNVYVQLWSTRASAGKAFTGNVTVTDSVADFIGGFAVVAFNVGSFGWTGQTNSGSTTTPTITLSATHDANNLMLTAFAFNNATSTTASANTGTLQSTFLGNATQNGGALVTNLQAAVGGTPTTSVTLSNSSIWSAMTMELRSVQFSVPTLYFPTGTYNYTSGLSFTNPVTLKGEPGSVLCYNGNAHAIDIGPNNLTATNFQNTYYTISGLTFTCGQTMTQGIFVNNLILLMEISNNQFLNFGPGGGTGSTTVSEVWLNGNQNDLVMTNNKYIVNDGNSTAFPGTTGTPRQWLNETTGTTSATTIRFENNSAECISGQFGNVGCNSVFGTSPPLIDIVGITHIITGNNFMGGFCPTIQLETNDINTKIAYNHFESDAASCYGIVFDTGVVGLRVIENNFKQTNSGATLIGPKNGSSVLTTSVVADNYMVNYTVGNPVVTLNNVAAQTGNIARGNMCQSPALAYASPCTLLHTTGSNIIPWASDIGDIALGVSSSLPTITGTGACATTSTQSGSNLGGTITCTGTTGASTLIITPTNYTAPHGFACSASDLTTAANTQRQSATSTAACTIAGTVNASDVLTYILVAY